MTDAELKAGDEHYRAYVGPPAQSIFSHTGRELTVQALRRLGEALAPTGLLAVTFVEGFRDFQGEGWVYPGVVRYRRRTIRGMAGEAGLFVARIPWFHPRQTWYLLSRRKERLPSRKMCRVLTGSVLFDDGFSRSWNRTEQVKEAIRKPLVEGLLHPLGAGVRRLLGRADSD